MPGEASGGTPNAGGAAPPAGTPPAGGGTGGGNVSVVYGANSREYGELVGRRVSEARDFLAEAMNIPRLPTAVVGGRNVERDYVLRPGDRLEFVQEQGRKGV